MQSVCSSSMGRLDTLRRMKSLPVEAYLGRIRQEAGWYRGENSSHV